jgi:hypothetical protein
MTSPIRTPQSDRARITATVRAYATALDVRDLDLLRRVVTDPILIDFSSWDPSREAGLLSFSAWTNGLRLSLAGYDASLHTIKDPRITIVGDEATSVSAMRAEHYFNDENGTSVFVMTGHYTDTLVRDGDYWRISAKVLTMTGEQGSREIMATARPRGAARLAAVGDHH